MATAGNGPLAGIRVVDLTTVLSGPYTTRLLGDLGADVVKLEAPGGDVLRQVGPTPTPGMGPVFVAGNRNKRSLGLDLRTPGGRDVLDRLVDGADVLVHNMRPGAARRLGCDPERTRGRNPRLVHCAITGFGAGGPYEDLPAYDDVIQGATGMVAAQSRHGDAPSYVRQVAADKTVALHAFGAICAALVRRATTGEGDTVEVPMFETLVAFTLLEHQYGRVYDPPTGDAGYERVMSAERRPFRTADGWMSVVVYDDRQWRGFFAAIGAPHLADDPRYATHAARTAHTDELYAMVADALVSRTTADWLAELRRLDIPAMPVAVLDEVLDDPHLRAVQMSSAALTGAGDAYVRVRSPMRFGAGFDDDRRNPPRLGEHTREVLAEVGLDETAVSALLADGAAFE